MFGLRVTLTVSQSQADQQVSGVPIKKIIRGAQAVIVKLVEQLRNINN